MTQAADHIIDLLESHRSIRHFTADPVSEGDLRRAVAAGQRASTSSNIQGYCVIRVTDREARRQIADLAGPQEKIAVCGAFMVVCGDSRRHRLAAAAAGQAYRTGLEAFLTCVIDASLFAERMAIAFEAMGYGICYIGGIRNDLPRLGALLELPKGIYPLFGMCVGTPDESPTPRPRLPVDAVLLNDRYPADGTMLEMMRAYDQVYVRYMGERTPMAGRSEAKRPEAWTETRSRAYAEPKRTAVGPFYRAQGASTE